MIASPLCAAYGSEAADTQRPTMDTGALMRFSEAPNKKC
jgi:hypothetical protein